MAGLCALVLLGFSAEAFAQGTLSGVVRDATQANIPGVEVAARNTGTNISTTVITNDAGAYSIPQLLTPSTYELTASLPGFQVARVQNIELGTNQTLRYDITLEVQGAGQQVEVVVDAQTLLATSSPTVGEALTASQVSELPLVGGDVLQLIGVMAGVRGDANVGGTTFAGIRASSVNTVRDGLSVSDGRFDNGVFGTTTINPDLVAEVRLILTPVDAELGRGNGQVQITTRSGTNEYRGSAVWNVRNSGMNANTWGNNNDQDLNCPDADIVAIRPAGSDWCPTAPDWQNQNQYTLSYGGPIIRNKTFFYALWDQQLNNTRDLVSATVLTPTARQGIFRYWEGWSPEDAAAATITTGANPSTPSVDFSGTPVAPATFPDGTPYTGGLRCFSVFGDVKADGTSFTGADCGGGTIITSGGVTGNTYWDALRQQMDTTGWVSDFLTAMPLPTHYVTGDGLNTATNQWVRGSNATGSTFAVAVGTNLNAERKQFNGKIDHNFNDSHKMNFGLTIERTNGGVNLSNWESGLNGETSRRPWVLTSNLTSTLTPTIVNEVRIGVRKNDLEQNPTWDSVNIETRAAAREYWVRNSAGNPAVFVPQVLGFSGANTPYPGGSLNGNYTPLYSFGDTLSWVQGVHAWKFGGELRLTRSNGFSNVPNQPLVDIQGGAGGNTATGIANSGAGAIQASTLLRGTPLGNARSLLYMLAGSVNTANMLYWVDEPEDVDTGTWESYYTPGSFGYTEEFGGRNFREQIQDELSFFVKDDWKVLPSLTLNLGLRWDHYPAPYLNNGLTTTLIGQGEALFGAARTGLGGGDPFSRWLFPGDVYLSGYGPTGALECLDGVANGPGLPDSNCDPALLSSPEFVGAASPNPDKSVYRNDLNNWGPAVGFAWQMPWGNPGQTTMRGGYQITYGGSGRNVFGDGGRIGGALGISLNQVLDLAPTLAAQPDGYLDLNDLDALFPITPGLVPGGTLPVYSRNNGFDAFDPNLETPYVQNFNLSVTRQLNRNMTVQVSYVGTQAKSQLGAIDLNLQNIWKNPELMAAIETTRTGGDAPLFDQMFAGVNLANGFSVASGGAAYTAVGTTNADGVLQTGSMHIRRRLAEDLGNGDFLDIAEFINENNGTGGTVGLLAAPALPGNVGGRLLRNGCDRLSTGAATIGDVTGQVNGLSSTPLRCFPENYIAMNPQFDEGADYVTNSGSSSYHSMQSQFTLRPTFGTNFQATYTWSKSMEIDADSWVDPLNRRADLRLADNHRTHDFRLNGTFQLPMGPGQLLFGNSTGFVARAIEGWRMSWIYSAESGEPLTISSGGGNFNKLYANGTPHVDGFDERKGQVEWGEDFGASTLGGSYLGDGYVQVTDPQCAAGGFLDVTDTMGWNLLSQGNCDMTAIALTSDPTTIVLRNAMPGERGTLGQTTFEGPGSWSLDGSLSKEFQVMEDKRFELRIDATNILNHANPGDPTLSINSGGATPWGAIANKGGAARNFQGQLRFSF
jgi:hypothetical protein